MHTFIIGGLDRQETHILGWEGGRDFPVRSLTKLAVSGIRGPSQLGWAVGFWFALARINKSKVLSKGLIHVDRRKWTFTLAGGAGAGGGGMLAVLGNKEWSVSH